MTCDVLCVKNERSSSEHCARAEHESVTLVAPRDVEPRECSTICARANADTWCGPERSDGEARQSRSHGSNIEEWRELDEPVHAQPVFGAHMCQRLILKAGGVITAQRLAAAER